METSQLVLKFDFGALTAHKTQTNTKSPNNSNRKLRSSEVPGHGSTNATAGRLSFWGQCPRPPSVRTNTVIQTALWLSKSRVKWVARVHATTIMAEMHVSACLMKVGCIKIFIILSSGLVQWNWKSISPHVFRSPSRIHEGNYCIATLQTDTSNARDFPPTSHKKVTCE